MGEVYKARDTRLDRTVAIKVLSPALAADPQFRERFEREARAVSALDHPNICALYDVGRERLRSKGGGEEEVDFLVMQFLDGVTLTKRLERGPLKLDEVLRTAMEIAGALDTAHRAGITHRDLKPGNVMLTASGSKLLDFGLAKLGAPAAAAGATAVPTMELTTPGAILGTFQYMAPEQLDGGDARARTDIFAFGAVVYEMATGRKAFEGTSRATLIGAILRDDPPPISAARQPGRPGSSSTSRASATWSGAVASGAISAGLDRVVRRCLAKSPDDRWQTASDLLEALRWVSEGRAQDVQPSAGAGRRSIVERVAWAAAVVLVGGLAAWGWLRAEPPPERARFTFALPHDDVLTGNGIAYSPDGTVVVVTGTHAGVEMLYRRTVDQLEAVPIRGTEGGEYPFFSTDGKWLGFFTSNALKKVPAEGGPPATITPTGGRYGASWGPDATIVFASTKSPDLMRVPASGGTPEVLVPASAFKGATSLRFPTWLPDGSTVLFSVFSGSLGSTRVGIHLMKTGESRVLVDGTNPAIAPNGQLLFARAGSLWAVPLDSRKLTIAGPPAPVLEGLQVNGGGLALFAVARSGSLAFRPGTGGESRTVGWTTRGGVRQPLIDKPQGYLNPSVSPDGRRVAVQIDSAEGDSGNDSDIWVYDIEAKALSRLTFGGGRHTAPMWTPDGRRVIYAADTPENVPNMFWTAADGTGQPEQLLRSRNPQIGRAVTPDGKTLVFDELGPSGKRAISFVALEGDRKPQIFLHSAFNEWLAVLSPDGRWIAYTSDESGRYEIYVRPFPGPGGKWQISTNGGTAHIWSPNGRELYFYGGRDQGIMAATVETGSFFKHATPRPLFNYIVPVVTLSISPDGQRFLLLQGSDATETNDIVVALDWAQGLKPK